MLEEFYSPEKKYKQYISPEFARLLTDFLNEKKLSSRDAASLLVKKLRFKYNYAYQVVCGLNKGNLFGGGGAILLPNSPFSLKDYALRLSHYLYALKVPKDSELIEKGRNYIEVNFAYPPKKPFPLPTKRKSKTS